MKRRMIRAVTAAAMVPVMGGATFAASVDGKDGLKGAHAAPVALERVDAARPQNPRVAALLSSTGALRQWFEDDADLVETAAGPMPDKSNVNPVASEPDAFMDVIGSALGQSEFDEQPLQLAQATEKTQEEIEAEAKADAEAAALAEEQAKAEAQAKADAEAAALAEEQVKAEAQAKADAEAAALAEEQVKAEAQAKADAEAAALAEEQAKAEAQAKADAEAAALAEEQAKAEAQAKADAEAAALAEEQAKAEAQAKADAEAAALADEQARVDADAKAKAMADEQAKAEQQPAAPAASGTAASETPPAAAESGTAVEATATGTPDATGSGTQTTSGEAAAAQPTAAPAPAATVDAPIAKRIRAAETIPTAIVPDNVSEQDRQRLREAEERRRKDAKKRRNELIGAAAAGVAVGALLPLLGGKVVEDQGDRFVVERDGDYFVRKDESALLRDYGTDIVIEDLARGRTRETITRRNGVKVVTLRSAGGYVLRRVKVFPDGDEVVLFDASDERDHRPIDYDHTLPPLLIDIPREDYIVSGGRRNRAALRETFLAPPVEQVESGYTLREVRESSRLRAKVRRVDLDTITFDTGSAALRRSQVEMLGDIAGSMLDVIEQDPKAVFLIEGHSDAVGAEVYNLTLSDRRAESVARILVEAYGLPPENLIIEGYGEAYLKVDTQEAERQNRRVTVRNISPLLQTSTK